MASLDAPDWERIAVTVQAMGDVPDAPDWQRIVVGPGATPVGGGGSNGWAAAYFNAGFMAMTINPMTPTSSAVVPNTVPVYIRFAPARSGTITYLWPVIYTGGTPVAYENFMGLYDTGQATAGTATLLSATPVGACDAPFSVTGWHQIALTTPVTVSADEDYFIAMLTNFTGNVGNIVMQGSTQDYAAQPFMLNSPFAAVSPAGRTTLPATVAFSTMQLSANFWLFAAS